MVDRVFLLSYPKAGMDFVARILGGSWCFRSSLSKGNLGIILTIWLDYFITNFLVYWIIFVSQKWLVCEGLLQMGFPPYDVKNMKIMM